MLIIVKQLGLCQAFALSGRAGAGTVAGELDVFLYSGSYVGDRIIKIAVPAGA
jgi:hypothetical protein